MRHLPIITTACLLLALPAASWSAENNSTVRTTPLKSSPTSARPSRIIVQHRDTPSKGHTDTAAMLTALQGETGVKLLQRRSVDRKIEVLQGDAALSATDLQRAIRLLQQRADIEYAVLDQRRYAHAIPSDALYPTQWFLQGTQPAGIDAASAWDVTTGGSGTVVAVLDTGVRFDHPDLQRAAQAGKLLPGFDFVSGENSTSFLAANDGNGWDSDPSDPGDWISGVDQQRAVFSNCTIENSSWHGTRIAGLIGAASNNGIGVSGVSWGAYILPVRVLGKCGGFDEDIIPAMRWAAGLNVSGVPDNPYPAKILNLSLGSVDVCNAAYQSVIQELATIGVLVIVSAGNDGGAVNAPGNCPYALPVAGLRHAGTKVGFSSLGPQIAIAAPAGNCVNLSGPCLFSLHTTYDIGTTSPAGSDYTSQFNTNLGTSFSAPLVAGVLALMHATNGKLTNDQLRARLQASARPFPVSDDPAVLACHAPTGPSDLQLTECNCTPGTCGAGMLHAAGAVAASQRPIVSILTPAPFAPGSAIVLDGIASAAACNRTISSYLWTVESANGTSPPTLTIDNQASLQVDAPSSGSYTLRLTVTDDQGATDSGDVLIDSSTATTAAATVSDDAACPTTITIAPEPAPVVVVTPGHGGAVDEPRHGGGSMSWYALALLLTLAALRTKSTSAGCALTVADTG